MKKHLLGLVSANKGHVAPTPSPSAAEFWSNEAASKFLQLQALEGIQSLFWCTVSRPQQGSGSASAAPPDTLAVYRTESTVRTALGLLQDIGALPDEAALLSAARAFVHDYLQANLYNTGEERLRLMSEEGTGSGGGAVEAGDDAKAESTASSRMTEADEREVMAWLDMPLIFPEFVEAVIRWAHQVAIQQDVRGGLVTGLRTLLQDEEKGLFSRLHNLLDPPLPPPPVSEIEAEES